MDKTKNQTNLYCLGEDKEIIKKVFLQDEDIIGLLLPEHNPGTFNDDLETVLEKHIFDTIAVDNTQFEAKVYICMDTYVTEVDSDAIKEIGIIIRVFCHKDLLKTSNKDKIKYIKLGYFGNRIDMLIDAIDRCLNGKRGVGIGRMRLRPRSPVEIIQPTNDYYGKSLTYLVSDFNALNKI